MRALKITAGVIGALALLVILSAVALVLFVDPNDYRDDIARLVQEKTGRALRINGELKLDLFPWLALQVNDVALGNPPGYGEEPFLTARHANLGVKLMPLLRKEVQVRRVALDGLAIQLISRSETDNNWQDLGKKDAEPATQDAQTPITASIAGVDVTDSLLTYRDLEENSTTRLTNIELHTGPLGASGEPTDVNLAFNYVGEEGEPLPISLHAPALALHWKAETLALTKLDIQLGELPIQATAQGQKLFTDRILSGELNIARRSARDLLQAFDIEPPNTRDSKALSQLEFHSDYRLTEKALDLSKLRMSLDDTQVSGTAGIADLESMALVFNLKIDAIDLDRYREPEQQSAQAAPAAPRAPGVAGLARQQQANAQARQADTPEEPFELPVELLRKLNAKGRLHIGRAKLADLPFTQVQLPLTARDGQVRIGPTQAQLFGGSYSGNIALDARAAQARLSLNEQVRGIDLGALMQAAFDTNRVSGRGDAQAALSATGNTDAAILKSLAGRISTDVKEGAINGVDLWYELRRARAVLERQPLPTRSGAPRTAFNTFAASATLNNGVMRNEDLRMDMEYLKARGQGLLNIATKAVDYRLIAEVYKLPAQGAGGEMASLKALEIPISITGTLDDMKVRPDLQSLVKARVRKEVDEKVQEKKEELKKKLGDKLRDLLGG